jgi:hypothetical protein
MTAKLVPTSANRGCRVVSATDPHDRILGFLDRKYHSIAYLKAFLLYKLHALEGWKMWIVL